MAPSKPRFGNHFAKLHRLMAALCKEEISQLGIQPSPMLFITALLHRKSPITQDELSAALVIDKAATASASLLLFSTLGLMGTIFSMIKGRVAGSISGETT